MNNREFGYRGEYLARLYLEKKGMTFIRANYNTKHGEIDLIMQENDELVIVEVKTRTWKSAEEYGRGILRIDRNKQKHLRRCAKTFLWEEPDLTKNLTLRFDAVELYLERNETDVVHVIHTPCYFHA